MVQVAVSIIIVLAHVPLCLALLNYPVITDKHRKVLMAISYVSLTMIVLATASLMSIALWEFI
mgnify:FL=1